MKRPFILILLLPALFIVAVLSNRGVLGQTDIDATPQAVERTESSSNRDVFLPIIKHFKRSNPAIAWSSAEKRQIENTVNNAGKLAPLADNRHLKQEAVLEPGDFFRYTYEQHDVVENAAEVAVPVVPSTLIWPGNLVYGASAHEFTYTPINLPRDPVLLSMTLDSSCMGPDSTLSVADPHSNRVLEGVSVLLRKAATGCSTIPAKDDYFAHEQIYNESHMNLFAKAKVGNGIGNLESKLNFKRPTKKNKIMARYQLTFFAVDVDVPASRSALFDPSLTSVGEIAAAMPHGSNPLFVASVNFGLLAHIFIETDFAYNDVAEALDWAEKGGDLEQKLGSGYSTKEIIEGSDVNIEVFGASAKGLAPKDSGFAGFERVMGISKDFTPHTPGVPVSYQFRHLQDDTPGIITLSSLYTIVEAKQIEMPVEITVDRFYLHWGDDEGPGNLVDFDRLFVWVNGFIVPDLNDPSTWYQVNIPDDEGVGMSKVVAQWTRDDWSMANGESRECMGQPLTLGFSIEEPATWLLFLKGYAREYDPVGSNEEAWAEITVFGTELPTKKNLVVHHGGEFMGEYQISIDTLSPTPLPPPPPLPASLVSFRSFNYPSHYLLHKMSDTAELQDIKNWVHQPEFAADATFRRVPGLADSSLVSFEAVNHPGYYLHNQDFELKLQEYNGSDAAFALDATFRIVPGLADSSLTSLEPINFPGYYLRHQAFKLKLHPYEDADLYREDATFAIAEMPGLAELDAQTAAQIMKDNGLAASQTASLLKDVFSLNAWDAAVVMKYIGFPGRGAYDMLSQSYGLDDVAQLDEILNAAGYLREEYLGIIHLEKVKQFAPILQFDKAHSGLPMSAGVYFDSGLLYPALVYPSENPDEACLIWTTDWEPPCDPAKGIFPQNGRDEATCGMSNNDFQKLRDGAVPTYYKVIAKGEAGNEGRLRIAYWWFYGFQKHCNPAHLGPDGSHHGDWEHVVITTTPDRSQVEYVTYELHGQWYTRRDFPQENNRPLVYVGKVGHGSYHNQDNSGWMIGTPHYCCHWADYRNPVEDSIWRTIPLNLVDMQGYSESWMRPDLIGSRYKYGGKEYEIATWRWGPHISYWDTNDWWEHNLAVSRHPMVDDLSWTMPSCHGEETCESDCSCSGLVYGNCHDYNQGWPWDSMAALRNVLGNASEGCSIAEQAMD